MRRTLACAVTRVITDIVLLVLVKLPEQYRCFLCPWKFSIHFIEYCPLVDEVIPEDGNRLDWEALAFVEALILEFLI